MSSPRIERKLAAIMFTDIAGYTALSAKDENKALELLDTQKQLLTPIIEEFNGTLHNKVGDGLLFTFPTVTDAVKCGIKIQQETKEVEDLNLRIGIHEGEITLKDGDALGDDVNVASRIDPFAAEGGIVISGKVQQNISSLPEFKTKFISEPLLKGVRQEVKIFCIISHGLPETDITKVTAKLEKDVKKLWYNQKSIIKAIAIISVLTIGIILWISKNNWDFNKDSSSNKYFIHITSNERYIEDYFVDMGGMLKGFDKNKYALISISDSLLNYIHETVFSNVVSRFHNLDVEIETHINKEEFNLLNDFPSPRGFLNLVVTSFGRNDSQDKQMEGVDSIASLYLSEEKYLKFENKINERIDFIPDYIIVVDIYNLYDKELDELNRTFYDLHLLVDFNGNFVGPYSPGTFSHDPSKIIKDSDELIEKLTEEISQYIRGISFGNLIIGEVSEILDNNIVKILLYDNQTVNRNVTLAHKLEYVWIDDGYEKRIEDIELGLEYSQNNPEKLDSTKYQKLLLELKGLKDGTDRNRGERAGMGMDYTLDIIDVIDNTIIAKIISKDPPYTKVRLEDRIRIKYE